MLRLDSLSDSILIKRCIYPKRTEGETKEKEKKKRYSVAKKVKMEVKRARIQVWQLNEQEKIVERKEERL